MLGLYLHVPFCASICSYCTFTRGLFDAGLKTAYVQALEREIRSCGDVAPADTIYFGGGTPSLLDPGEISRLVGACRDACGVAPGAEVTLEANPDTVTAERLSGFREAGVTRVSFGVQSFRPEDLRRLGRAHSVERARAAFDEARATGFDNVSLDLMMWLPGQRLGEWLESVDALIALGPEHASLYLLELYPNAPLQEEMARAGWTQAPDAEAADMYLQGLERLEAVGYRQYEISNVARPGRECRHNLKYWQDGEWLGFGCGAHSTRGGARWQNVAPTVDYIERVRAGRSTATGRRDLSPGVRAEEALFTGLRLAGGLDLARVRERYGIDVWAQFGRALESFVETGLLIYDADRLVLTRRGMLLSNEVLAVFIDAPVR